MPLVTADFLITVAIPLYNGESFIRETIQSVLDQTLPPDEIIVVDDGSTDAGPAIIAELARTCPIRLITTPNRGQSTARNTAVHHAHGDLIAFLDQDDIWYPNHLAELIGPFLGTRARELGWSYSDLDEVDESGQMVGHAVIGRAELVHPKPDLATCLKQDMFILPSASLVSRRAFLAVGGFDERLSGYEDDDLFLRLFQAGFDHAFLPQALSKWRIYRSSCSYSPRMAVSRRIYASLLIERFPDEQYWPRTYIRDMIAPRFVRTMAGGLHWALLKGTRAEQAVAFEGLTFICKYMPLGIGLPFRLFIVPALRIRPLGRWVMRHRKLLRGIVRRIA
ncbi:MAG: glycosyltransferase family 2 protein [Rhodopila sp.]